MSLLGLFDYPKEIKQLESQIPTSDRDAFLSRYKKLSKNDKMSFKQALHNADIDAANKIIGEDLNQYHVTLNKVATKTNGKTVIANKGAKNALAVAHNSLANKISEKQIAPAILPAEAARRYATFSTSSALVIPANAPVKAAATAISVESVSSKVASSANDTKLSRIDSSGIFAMPDKVSSDKIKSVLVNGKPISQDKYAITENGNLDIFEADKDSTVSIVL